MIRRAAHALRVGRVMPLPLTMRLYGGTDKLQHGYADHYQRHLKRRRWRRMVVIEIGVGGYSQSAPSGSLRVWRDYLPRSTILGVDLHPKHIALGPRVVFAQLNQASAVDWAKALENLRRPPDLVIDDGSHRGSDTSAAFRYLYPQLRRGGLYVIEDLHTSYWPKFGGAVPAPDDSAVALTKQLVDEVQALDEIYTRKPHWGGPPEVEGLATGAVHVYPGIVFIEKASDRGT
jgi:hypothetical protein